MGGLATTAAAFGVFVLPPIRNAISQVTRHLHLLRHALLILEGQTPQHTAAANGARRVQALESLLAVVPEVCPLHILSTSVKAFF